MGSLITFLQTNAKSSVQKITEQIHQLAHKRSLGTENTPFQERMNKANGSWIGGKKDDITVIVSSIQ